MHACGHGRWASRFNPAADVAGTGAISGIVVDRATNQPVAGVLVELGPRIPAISDQSRRQLTDSKGRFIFSRLAPYAGYSLSASKAGYLRPASALHPRRFRRRSPSPMASGFETSTC
jgi:hypothetical protein